MNHIPLPRTMVSHLRHCIHVINVTDGTYLENGIVVALNPIITIRSQTLEIVNYIKGNLTDTISTIIFENLLRTYGEFGYEDTVRMIASYNLLSNITITTRQVELLIGVNMVNSIMDTSMIEDIIELIKLYIKHMLNYDNTRDGIYMSMMNILNTLSTYRELNPREVYMTTVTKDGVLLTLGR